MLGKGKEFEYPMVDSLKGISTDELEAVFQQANDEFLTDGLVLFAPAQAEFLGAFFTFSSVYILALHNRIRELERDAVIASG